MQKLIETLTNDTHRNEWFRVAHSSSEAVLLNDFRVIAHAAALVTGDFLKEKKEKHMSIYLTNHISCSSGC